MADGVNIINSAFGKGYALYNGDSAEILTQIPSESIHYSIFSPPFQSLYTFSNSDRDLSNCATPEEFWEQFGFIGKELFRVIKPGRIMSVHCTNLTTSKERDGYIGLRDFRGELIRFFQEIGFIYHSEVTIWKNPAAAMQRTKSIGLLHKQLKKDSCISRQALPDYLIMFRKPGENQERVTHTNESFPVELWEQYASPVWMDINPSDTLQRKSARDDKDEKHISVLQLEVIERAIDLWSNPGDVVLTPFLGIGSEAYVALQKGRKAIGIELKESYFKQAVANCKSVADNNQISMEELLEQAGE